MFDADDGAGVVGDGGVARVVGKGDGDAGREGGVRFRAGLIEAERIRRETCHDERLLIV